MPAPRRNSFAGLLYFLCCLSPLASIWAQATKEVLLSATENAYNPIPSPDGKLIAYVRTGWQRPGGSGGFGRSNLRSYVAVMTPSGEPVTEHSLADAFLAQWTSSGTAVACYRDGTYMLVLPTGEVSGKGRISNRQESAYFDERIAYLSNSHRFIWVKHRGAESVIQMQHGPIARSTTHLGKLIVPSPDERYIAVADNQSDLWVYDTHKRHWVNLGSVTIHPSKDWEYVKPTWNPWFPDSSRLVFFSGSNLIVASPDGQRRSTLLNLGSHPGLAAVSGDGKFIAFATFEKRPMQGRPDLGFWGGTTLWVISTAPGSSPRAVTSKSDDTTYSLRWLGNSTLVFDRLEDVPFYSHARLWVVSTLEK